MNVLEVLVNKANEVVKDAAFTTGKEVEKLSLAYVTILAWDEVIEGTWRHFSLFINLNTKKIAGAMCSKKRFYNLSFKIKVLV